MIRVLCALLLTMILATSSWAGAADDLAAGLAAAKNGRHDEAITLLTRALDAGGLSGDEQVTANKTRGAEYMTKSLMADAFGRRDEGRRLRDRRGGRFHLGARSQTAGSRTPGRAGADLSCQPSNTNRRWPTSTRPWA